MNVEKCKEGAKKITTAILQPLRETVKTIIFGLLGLLVLGFVVECLKNGPANVYYGLLNDVSAERVTIMPQPHDCDFSKAPIGDKECHYERVVTKSSDKQGNFVIIDWHRVNE
jgi:hypothetical protein